MNRTIITGNLTRDIELKYTQGGMAIAELGVAVNERVRRGEQWEDEANFFDCVIFGRQAETASEYLAKGSKVGIDGRLRQDRWEKDGQKRSKVVIFVDRLEFLSPKSDGARPAAQEQSSGGDDIPF